MNIKELRQMLVLTQEELGELLGVCRETVIGWESGKREMRIKNKRKLNELCERRGIRPEWFM